jgi:hypothetical protein
MHMLEPRSKEEEIEILGGLAEVYTNACNRKNYQLCDRVRASIQMHLAGKSTMIKIDTGLELLPTLW